MDQVWIAVISGLSGAIITSVIAWYLGSKTSQEKYYDSLVKLLEHHNWNMKLHGLDSGLTVKNVDPKVSVVCYQHLNILLYVWLNRKIAVKDGSMKGWKNWADEILRSCDKVEKSEYRTCYRQILTHGDIYPERFIQWLDQELGLSVKNLREVH